MTMWTRMICLALCVNCCYATKDQSACRQLRDAANSLCMDSNSGFPSITGSPGKRGPVGSPGRTGSPGAVGPSGVVDYDRIDSEINRKIQKVIAKNDAEKRILLLTIANLKDKVQLLENRGGACEIKYDNKCFWLVALDHWVTGYDVGVQLCAVRGGSPANIYSEEHYDIIMIYFRSRMLHGRDRVFAWIGMKTHPPTGAVSLSDGTPATFMKWYPGYPSKNSEYTHMTIVQRNPSTQSKIGIHNWSPSSTRDAVLCEL